MSPRCGCRRERSRAARSRKPSESLLYLIGRGVVHDDSTAAKWLSKAPEQGHHEAQAKLALLYEKGRGIPRDLNRADFGSCCR